ncbi:MAG TPA: hypothetical protein VJL29_04170 [Thermoguttaceae bacterium]|nr:hypothetical protein [Thermoguttaceae bacterium]
MLTNSAIQAAQLDADHDGWYTAKKNERVTLTLVGLSSNVPGDYRVTVDGVRCPYDEKNLSGIIHAQVDTLQTLDCIVATRAIGAWLQEGDRRQTTWKSPVTVTRCDAQPMQGTTTLSWSNRPADRSATVSLPSGEQVRLDFRITVETFADADPRDRNGDADHDGLFDWEEADYARRGITLGDPNRKDLILVVAHTHNDWRMTDLTKTLLRTCFRRRGVNSYLASNDDESLGLCQPGLASLDGRELGRDHALSLQEATRIRKVTLKSPMTEHAHLVVLSAYVAPDPRASWGWADLPGGTLVVRSHLSVLGPDFHQYQAKTILHELGHNLGLCHPEQSDRHCPTGAIPKAERSSALTVMGTPRADRGDPVAIVTNAWARPLDYSPTQWKKARFDWVREENRSMKSSVREKQERSP